MIVRQPDVAAFRQRVERWLLASEAENNLILSLIESVGRGRTYGGEPPYFFTVEPDGAVEGCAVRTPPLYPLSVSRMPPEAVPPLVRDIAAFDGEMPSVLGPAATVEAFAEEWSAATGQSVRPGMRQRIYELIRLTPPPRRVSGNLRPARDDELDFLAVWGTAFDVETGMPRADAHKRARGWFEDGRLFVWEDGQPVSMAAVSGLTPHGARIGFVYTPQDRRGRGYGTACTAALSQLCLDEGRAFCCLYTDLANPTSNRIYQQIGYRPVCDVAEVRFSTDSTSR